MKAAVTAMFNNTMRSSRYTVLGASPLQGSLRCDFGDHPAMLYEFQCCLLVPLHSTRQYGSSSFNFLRKL